ncbi:helix-turn-helix domain-containing protein [Robertmurraya siralis]|jgi:transcriptional regulator with XRE-family HTH domain|uniref:helix-turn-helix domain-containing protein n=1 Tax=Robertmurraya siralis TaxID=77777 RepID=UPI001B8686C1|nr:helix-turn-helix transcriptional regulator [Robertmurraya siralis]
MKFGAILKACRERAGYSQEELAFRLSINQSDVSKIEKDYREPTISLFQAWIQNTQTPEVIVAFLYGMDGISMISQLMPLIGGFILWM